MKTRVRKWLFLAALLATAVAISIPVFRSSDARVSTAFRAYHYNGRDCEAVITLSNHSSSTIQFDGILTCNRTDRDQLLQIGRPAHLSLGPERGASLGVTVPLGGGPAHLCCVLRLVGRHPPLVRRAGALLARFGIYVYHAPPPSPFLPGSKTSGVYDPFQPAYASAHLGTLRIQFRGKRPIASLSDNLGLRYYTNSWTTP